MFYYFSCGAYITGWVAQENLNCIAQHTFFFILPEGAGKVRASGSTRTSQEVGLLLSGEPSSMCFFPGSQGACTSPTRRLLALVVSSFKLTASQQELENLNYSYPFPNINYFRNINFYEHFNLKIGMTMLRCFNCKSLCSFLSAAPHTV